MTPPIQLLNSLRLGEPLELPHTPSLWTVAEYDRLREYLHHAYLREAPTHVAPVPAFDGAAALYGFELVLAVAYVWYGQAREEGDAALPEYEGEFNAGAQLSADLTLRYLPALINRIAASEPDAAVVKAAGQVLRKWPYTELLGQISEDWTVVSQGLPPALIADYVDRIIERRQLTAALHPSFRDEVAMALGGHAAKFWPNFATALKAG